MTFPLTDCSSLLQSHTYFSYVTDFVFRITFLLTGTVFSKGGLFQSITPLIFAPILLKTAQPARQCQAKQGGKKPSLQALLPGLMLEMVLCTVTAPVTSSAGSSPKPLQQAMCSGCS